MLLLDFSESLLIRHTTSRQRHRHRRSLRRLMDTWQLALACMQSLGAPKKHRRRRHGAQGKMISLHEYDRPSLTKFSQYLTEDLLPGFYQLIEGLLWNLSVDE